MLLHRGRSARGGACAPKNFSMEGKDAEQMTKDESQCRAQVRSQAQQERNIEDQRRSVFDGERERYGQQDLYRTMDNQGYKNNVERMTARCMEARGWAPKNQNAVELVVEPRVDLQHAGRQIAAHHARRTASAARAKNSTITPNSTSTKAFTGMA